MDVFTRDGVAGQRARRGAGLSKNTTSALENLIDRVISRIPQ